MNCADGSVLETSLRFQNASAAFIHPARRPTRGSWAGAAWASAVCVDRATAAAATSGSWRR